MRYKLIAAAALLAPLAACNAVADKGMSPAQAELLQRVADREQIEDLMWQYARTLDSADADGYVGIFTPDGKFVNGGMAMEGREALHKFVADLKKSREERRARGENPGGTLHMTANHKIEFTGADSALVHSYWITMFPAQGSDNPARVGFVGIAEDQLVRVDGKWLFKVRNVGLTD